MTSETSNLDDLSEKLRRDNYDQFIILVRMHLSFVLDLSTDDNEVTEKGKLRKWNLVPFAKKSKCRGVMDGAPLTQEGICQAYQLIEFLRKEQNISVEGVFRRTGSLTRQQELRNLLNQGVTLNLENGTFSVHDCASVLKGFLAELPEPLLTEAHYPAYCQIAELCGVIEKPTQEPRLLHALQLVLLLLPSENKVLLKDLLQLLNLTASYETKNKMSADSLATLFTPHLLCPRKLSPEALHVNSQTMCGIISFMITNWAELFQTPPKLAVDIKAYYSERERRKLLSPKNCFNESVSDNFAANTVYTFLDFERTSKENQSNPTETALAQLYAHIQSLPESSKKRKLIKQFNKENGQGTPLQLLRSQGNKNKGLCDSIKRHIFHKGLARSGKKSALAQLRSSSDEILTSPQGSTARARLFCTKCEPDSDVSIENDSVKKLVLERSLSEPSLIADESDRGSYLTSTPACGAIVFTPEDQGRKSMSPITRSTQRMCRAMQETMMTPRSRKPVLLVSGTNLTSLPKVENPSFGMNSLEEESESEETPSPVKKLKSESCTSDAIEDVNSSLTSTFREYLCSRSILTTSPTDSSFSSQTDDFEELDGSKLSASLLQCLDGNVPEESTAKEFVLKPKFDENGRAVVYETSF